jgi:hypothetical protein
MVEDLGPVAERLEAKGIGILARDHTTILADPAHTYGAPIRFTTVAVPGDPRD